MTKVLGLFLGLAVLSAGCGSDKEKAAAIRSFTSSYKLGTWVVGTGAVTSTTKRYVDLGGVVTQVNDLHPTASTSATGGVCKIDADLVITESASSVSEVTKIRIAGHQKAWILPDAYKTANADSGTNVWGDPANGGLFLIEPNLDILLDYQRDSQGIQKLDQYLKTIPVDLFIFEKDSDFDSITTDTTRSKPLNINDIDTTVDETTNSSYKQELSTFGRFLLEKYVWETNSLGSLYSSPYGLGYSASMILPDNVKVGSTWLADNGNLMAAVGTDVLTVGKRKIRALHIVERGATDLDFSKSGVKDWCVKYYNSSDTTDSTQKSSELTDLCDNQGGTMTNTGGDNELGTGWINQKHTWYYRGLLVKKTETRVDIQVDEFGYVTANDGILAAPDAGTTLGDCARYYQQAPSTTKALSTIFTPYARFTVMNSTRNWQAIEVRDDFTIAKEYKEDAIAAAKAAKAAK